MLEIHLAGNKCVIIVVGDNSVILRVLETGLAQCREKRRRVKMTRLLLLILPVIFLGSGTCAKNEGMFDKIKVGLQYASNYLETAREIADLVSRSLSDREKVKEKNEEKRGEDGSDVKGSETFKPTNLVSAFFRLLGLDSQKIAAIAVNSVIFLAQMISSLFDVRPPEANPARSLDQEEEKDWDPFTFIMENKNEKVQNLIKRAVDVKLSDQLIDRLDGFDSSCIRLLICKVSPVIKAAQNTLSNSTKHRGNRMIAWLPSRDDFESNADSCEDTHTDCRLFPES